MYARYVPPPKGSNALVAVQSPAASAATVSAAAAVPNSNPSPSATRASAVKPKLVEEFSYTRYVPAAKAKANAIAQVAPGPTSIQFFDDEPVSGTPKRKRDLANEPESSAKKLRKGKPETIHTSGANGVANTATPSLNERSGEKKKKNRRKRKQRTQAAADDSDSSSSSDDESDNSQVPVPTPSRKPKEKQKKKQRPTVQEEDVAMDDHKANPLVDDRIHANGNGQMNQENMMDTQSEPGSSAKGKKLKREKKKRVKDPVPDVKEEEGEEQKEEKEVDEKALARHKSVLERKTKSIKLASEAVQDQDIASDQESTKTYALEPLPQPAVVPDDESKPTYDTLPAWLSAPIRVAQDTRRPFTELGIAQRSARILAERGYAEAFAVQTAAIPLLLPTSKQRAGDVLVSAATGSGKTLAYALPIVRDISQGVVTRLRALVVLPTRELVKQAQDVFEICAKAYEGENRKRVRIGVAIGSQSIKSEEEALVERESRYDPDTYQAIQEEHKQRRASGPTSADVDEQVGLLDSAINDPRIGPWEGEVVDFSSKADILICTPGRLVEHIEQTPGFHLDHVRWLVVDEADKLLAQSFQGWLELVLDKFRTDKFGARDFPDMAYSGVRKVILSATLTRDLSLLNRLALRRPQLIVLENDAGEQVAEHTLPVTLREHAVRVHDANLKPLYLLDLLRGSHMGTSTANEGGSPLELRTKDDDGQSDSSSVASSRESESSSDDSSETSSDDSSDTNSDSDDSPDNDGPAKARTALPKTQLPICLIFTKSNESALRLSRLLSLLDASVESRIETLTSTTATHIRRKILRAFTTPASPVRLIIASDLVARGIDIPRLEHVVNYDLPASVAGYVHRVGRTARAGRRGSAWTLVGDDESGWFWGRIAKNPGVKRADKVQRTRIDEMSEQRIEEYEDALARLGKEALDLRRK
ncbi:hypothetical protein E4U42_006238 [Claviceps africana]|uniref:ATP-dependent RNA helicase n=1 Tax=Claviceps africana TaxID=83212 RepID=A0A8K0JBY2_9HYPO|nr:hypothetical protein E4U42_006238 [Claviceps africana]